MNCEEFLFEVSYLMETEDGGLGFEALAHADLCPRCHARFYQLKRQQGSDEMEFTPLMGQRLHQTLDLVISRRRQTSASMWLQMAFTCLLLVGSLVGIAYQNHPTSTPPVMVGR